jgi:sulfite exporter TauE/SafE
MDLVDINGSLITAFLVGLLGGVHCVAMCGGIVGTLTMGLPGSVRGSLAAQLPFQLAYNAGRVAGYTLAGALMGALGTLMVQALPLQQAQRALFGVAAAFMIALGLYLGGWWRGLTWVERAGVPLWRRVEPLGRRLLPVRNTRQALALGLVWAWLPCGLVYSVLIWSVSAGSAGRGAALMFAFGLGTLPNLLGISLLAGVAARFGEHAWLRRMAGLLVLGFGAYALWQLFLV